MKENEYKCASCGGIFEFCRPDEDAVAELKENFGEGIDKTDCDIICDDCYNEIMPKIFN